MIGKPEPLSGNLAGFWSRRINEEDRLMIRSGKNFSKLVKAKQGKGYCCKENSNNKGMGLT